MKIYDCFMFFDEEMLLDLRLNIMDKYVDKFVITEATYMHSGKPKKLLFDINKFSKFKDKIKNVPATFIIRVQGKSMANVGIYDGDLLVVDKSLKPKNFSTVIANVHDELVVKSFVKEKDEQFLTSGSKRTEDKIIINSESDIFVWGVVTYVIHSVY